jgi:pimeloyl-ACP methyl ester carboxylesterase
MWHGQIEPVTKAGYKLIIWDMRGHGRSSYPDDQNAYSEAHTVADMAALLDKVCGEGSVAIVGGLSLGGYMVSLDGRNKQTETIAHHAQ